MKVRCTKPITDSFGNKRICGWEGDEDDLEVECTYPGKYYGDPPEPPEYEAICPECGSWNYIEDALEEADHE